jgi:hypothetical protein
MKVWITSVFVVLGMVELYQWMKDFTLPLPVFILGGAALAIASNYGKYAGWSFQQPTQSDATSSQVPSGSELAQTSNQSNLNPSSAKSLPQSTRSISFTIRRPTRADMNNERGNG